VHDIGHVANPYPCHLFGIPAGIFSGLRADYQFTASHPAGLLHSFLFGLRVGALARDFDPSPDSAATGAENPVPAAAGQFAVHELIR